MSRDAQIRALHDRLQRQAERISDMKLELDEVYERLTTVLARLDQLSNAVAGVANRVTRLTKSRQQREAA